MELKHTRCAVYFHNVLAIPVVFAARERVLFESVACEANGKCSLLWFVYPCSIYIYVCE